MSDQHSVVFDRAADYYDETRGLPPGVEVKVAKLITQAGSLTPADRVLEVGVGTGRIALPLSQQVRAVYGIDLSLPMIKKLVGKRCGEQCYPIQGNAEKVPFAAGAFDAVVVAHVFHLVASPFDMLTEIGRVLRRGERKNGQRAVLLHCVTDDRQNQKRTFWNLWRETVPQVRAPANFDARHPRFFEEVGWQHLNADSEPQALEYTEYRTPRGFIDLLRRRVWSATWSLSDAELAHGIETLLAAVPTYFEDIDQDVPVVSKVIVNAFLPPQA